MSGTFAVKSSEAEVCTLKKAVMLYEGQNSAYATVHDIAWDKKGSASLLAGVAATQESLAPLAALFTKNVMLGGYLPDTVLSVGFDGITWWMKPQAQTVFFHTSESVIGTRSGTCPQPGLIFAVRGESWYVFAVKGNTRPTPDTALFLSPYMNVWSNGKICVGSTVLPEAEVLNSLQAREKAFFSSAFTHPNVHLPEKFVEYKSGPYKFWKKMLDGKFKAFPENVLVPIGKTLADLLK